MFNRKSPDEPHALDKTIEEAISGIAGLSDGSEEYARAAASLKLLIETRNADILAKAGPSVSPDAIAAAVASLLGIAAILGFEKANVVTSKALSFVPRPKF